MRSAWNYAKEVDFRAIKDNLFSIQFNCLGDWERVMNEGPWTFRGCSVLLAEYDGWSKIESVNLYTYPAWIQIHDLKEKIRTGSIATQLARRARSIVKLDAASVRGSSEGARVRVMLDVRKPLTRVVSTTLNKKKWMFRVMYEKMPIFCGVCGFVGHVTKEHGDGVHPPEAIQYPDNLIAQDFRRGSWGFGGGRGRGSGRGRERNDCNNRVGSESGNPEEMEDEDMIDTASSPSKAIAKYTGGSSSAKRRLAIGELLGHETKTDQLLLMDKPHGRAEGDIIGEEVRNDVDETRSLEEGKSSSRDSKRQKKKGEDTHFDDLNRGSSRSNA